LGAAWTEVCLGGARGEVGWHSVLEAAAMATLLVQHLQARLFPALQK